MKRMVKNKIACCCVILLMVVIFATPTNALIDLTGTWHPEGGEGGDPFFNATDTEAEMEAHLTDVTDIFTNNDGALDDDDVTLGDVQGACGNDFHNIGGVDATDDTVSGTELDALLFGANGLLRKTGANTFDTITDNSANWDNAFGWGNHSLVGYLTSRLWNRVGTTLYTATAGDDVLVDGNITATGHLQSFTGMFMSDLNVAGIYLNIASRLAHFGDTNTYLQFSPDRLVMEVGGRTMVDITEGATDTIILDADSVSITNGDLLLTGIPPGTDNTVLVMDGTTVKSDEIDSRVWGSTLSDETDLALKVPYTGATGNVNIGVHNFLGTDVDITGNIHLNDNKYLYLGTGNDGRCFVDAADDIYIENINPDDDIIIRANDGGVTKNFIKIDASIPKITLDQEVVVTADLTVADQFEAGKNGILYNPDTVRTGFGGYNTGLDGVVNIQREANRDIPGDDLLYLRYASVGVGDPDPVRMNVQRCRGKLSRPEAIVGETDILWDLSVDGYWADDFRQSHLMRWESSEAQEHFVPGIFRYFITNNAGASVEMVTIEGNAEAVGINNNHPGYTLDVGGTIYASDSITTNNDLHVADFAKILGGLHVGGTSDPGTDNLIVDGTSVLTGNTDINGRLKLNNVDVGIVDMILLRSATNAVTRREANSQIWNASETWAKIIGTPVNNQVAIFTDANTVEGDSNLTWDGSDLNVTGTVNASSFATSAGVGLTFTFTCNEGTVTVTNGLITGKSW